MSVYITTAANAALVASTRNNPLIGWNNCVTTSNISSTSAASGFPATNMANPSTRPQWKGATNSPLAIEYVTVIPGNGQLIDYLAIAAHNLGSIASKLVIETCTNVAASPQVWTAHSFGSSPDLITPTTDAPIIFRFVSSAYQGVRLKINVGTAAPQIGVMYVGALLVCERSIRIDTDHVPINYGKESKVISGMSESGNFLGRIVQTEWVQSEMAFSFFSNAWYRANFKPFLDAANETPFFHAWFPTDHPEDVGYVWLTDDPRSGVNTVTDRFNITLKYQGLAS